MQPELCKRPALIATFIIVASLLISGTARAQLGTPEVSVNMGVLQSPPLSQLDPLALDPAIKANIKRTVTSPEDFLSIEPAAGVSDPSAPLTLPVPSVDIYQPIKTDHRRITSFPIQMKTRQETLNPSVNAPRLLPLPETDISRDLKVSKEDATQKLLAYPLKKPEIPKPEVTAAHATPPLPPRRPAIQIVSDTYAASLRHQAKAQSSVKRDNEVKKTPAMPAIPAVAVEQELLSGDPLAQILIKPDRQKVADLVSKIQKPYIAPSDARASSLIPPRPAHKPLRQTATHNEAQYTINFEPGEDRPGKEKLSTIEPTLLSSLKENPNLRLQIKAFASINEGTGIGDSRRISLARALSIRSWLLENGIEARRMDIRALGDGQTSQAEDKVDLVLLSPIK